MKKLFPILLMFLWAQAAFGQEAGNGRLDEISKMAMRDTFGWTTGGGIGLDLGGMGLLNPKVGAGANRLGIGGLGTLFANRKEAKWYWNNQFSIQLSAQRLGRTVTSQPKVGFQKNLDVLRLGTRYGHKLGNDKWFVAIDGFAQTLALKTYASNYLKPISAEDRVVAKLFSPLLATVSPGIDYKPNEHLSFFYSPCGTQIIFVADDAIAATGVHGNDVTRDDQGRITEYKNTFFGLGSELKAGYNNKYFGNRLSVNSNLRLFSNYLKEPQNVDVLFSNNFSISIFKGLSLDLLAEYFYDHDVKVKKDVNGDDIYDVTINADGTTSGPDRLGRGGQTTGAFLLKYSVIF